MRALPDHLSGQLPSGRDQDAGWRIVGPAAGGDVRGAGGRWPVGVVRNADEILGLLGSAGK
jgi:hypothetical protein